MMEVTRGKRSVKARLQRVAQEGPKVEGAGETLVAVEAVPVELVLRLGRHALERLELVEALPRGDRARSRGAEVGPIGIGKDNGARGVMGERCDAEIGGDRTCQMRSVPGMLIEIRLFWSTYRSYRSRKTTDCGWRSRSSWKAPLRLASGLALAAHSIHFLSAKHDCRGAGTGG